MSLTPSARSAADAAAYDAQSVAVAYRLRPPYPAATFTILTGLLGDRPRRVLDAGCGTGTLARPLADEVEPWTFGCRPAPFARRRAHSSLYQVGTA